MWLPQTYFIESHFHHILSSEDSCWLYQEQQEMEEHIECKPCNWMAALSAVLLQCNYNSPLVVITVRATCDAKRLSLEWQLILAV